METKTIAQVNNVAIVAGNDASKLVPIKPICEALGIDFDSQRKKLKDDEDLNSTTVLSTVVAADGKEREMLCLPLEFVFGWLFTINPKNVKPEAQEAVRSYRMQCYRALYKHFTAYALFNEDKQTKLSTAYEKFKVTKKVFNEAKNNLAESERQMTIAKDMTFESWTQEKRQQSIDFTQETMVE